MTKPTDLSSIPDGDCESFPSTESFTFGLSVLGTAAIVTLIAMGCLISRYPALGSPSVWVGVGVTLAMLAFAFRRLLFGKEYLLIGKDRLSILGSSGNVEEEIPYASIAAVELIEKTSVEAPPPVFPSSPLKLAAREVFSGPNIDTHRQQRFLGIRFHDTAAPLDVEQRLAQARVRGSHRGCDWVL